MLVYRRPGPKNLRRSSSTVDGGEKISGEVRLRYTAAKRYCAASQCAAYEAGAFFFCVVFATTMSIGSLNIPPFKRLVKFNLSGIVIIDCFVENHCGYLLLR